MSWFIKFLVLLYIRYYMFVYTIQYRAFNRLSPLSLLQRSIAYCTIQVSSGWMYWLYFTLFPFLVCTLQCTVQYRRSKKRTDFHILFSMWLPGQAGSPCTLTALSRQVWQSFHAGVVRPFPAPSWHPVTPPQPIPQGVFKDEMWNILNCQ